MFKDLSLGAKYFVALVAVVCGLTLGMFVYDYGKALNTSNPEVDSVMIAVDGNLQKRDVKLSELELVEDSVGNTTPVQMLYYTTDSTKRIIQVNLDKRWWKYHVKDFVVKH